MIVSEFKMFLKGKKSNNGFNGANAKKDESNCFAGVTSYQEDERYNNKKSVGYSNIKDTFNKLYKMNIKVQKSTSSLLTTIKSLEGERDDAIKELKETNSKQEKKIANCMERMKLIKEEIEQKEKSLEISRMREEEVTKELTAAKESIKELILGAKKIYEMISL
ncbi:hypothetical protein ACOSQ4_004841 [Xanthoceras sorbifolium]